MSNGVVVIETRDNGQSFIFKDINLVAEQICHADKNKIIDKDLAEIYTTIPEYNLMDIIHQVWTTEKSKLIPEFYYHDKHIEAWWEIYVYKLTTGEIVMVIKDITKNKKLEESQEELNEMLKVINKIMRHDISNDLSIISMSLEVFEENSDKKYLELSQKSVKRCLKKISEMRNLEQTISNQYELKPYNLHDIVTEVSRNHLVKIGMNGSCVVMADEGLFSVVDNIITNAVNHGAATHIEITVNSNDTNVCNMRIADNGGGIPSSIKEHIFKEGFKYGEKGNTGLGLYIAKTIMNRYGSISVEDNFPSGAVFILTFSKHY
jgi:signal transduction histidine kinase